jgi:hypothetical protein
MRSDEFEQAVNYIGKDGQFIESASTARSDIQFKVKCTTGRSTIQ